MLFFDDKPNQMAAICKKEGCIPYFLWHVPIRTANLKWNKLTPGKDRESVPVDYDKL